jgi:hypothetical protein
MDKKYHLKSEYNWRGAVAELLARFYVKAYSSRSNKYHKPFWMPGKYDDFLTRNWSSIDLFRINEYGVLELFEVKTITDNKERIPDITRKTFHCYKEALRLGIFVKVIFVSFLEDWNLVFKIKNFEDVKFRINNGGWYRRS